MKLGMTSRVWTRQRLAIGTFLALLIISWASFVVPVRNAFLSSFIYPAWRDVQTSDLIRIRWMSLSEHDEDTHIHCSDWTQTSVLREHVNSSKFISHSRARAEGLYKRVAANGHGRYLPALTEESKLDVMYLYFVMAKALEQAGVRHFLLAGSMLGMERHGGFVPWDDDLDVAVSVQNLETVRKSLSCIRGFSLYRQHFMHWKFHYKNREEFPFIDIFFYEMDKDYAWALTHYIQITFIYPKKLIFPLKKASFEGHMLPFPRDSLGIAKRIYNFDICRAYQGHIARNMSISLKEFPLAYSITEVGCGQLSYLYDMKHLTP